MSQDVKLFPFDSTGAINTHRMRVRDFMMTAVHHLLRRGAQHDASKLSPEEKPFYDAVLPDLQGLSPGSPEYAFRAGAMGPALANHYAMNPDHPEHHPNGVAGMSLLDMLEMLADWKATSENVGGPGFAIFFESRMVAYKVSEDIANVLRKTACEFFWTTQAELSDVQKTIVDGHEVAT